MKRTDWVQELDNQILLNRRKILEGNGKISHKEAMEKAEKEFNTYREREMKELQSDFDLMMKSLPNSKEQQILQEKGEDFYEKNDKEKSFSKTTINWYKPTYGKLPIKAYK